MPVEPVAGPEGQRPRHKPFRPALWIAIPFAIGIALYAVAPRWVGGYAAIAAVLAVMLAALRSTRWLCLTLAGAALLFIGLAWAQINRLYAPPDDIALWVSGEPILIRARLQIGEPPVIRNTAMPGERAVACRAEMLAIEDGGAWRPACGSVLLRIAPAREGLRAQQEIEVIGELSRITGPVNPGEYDWANHFAREGIYTRLAVDRPEVVTIRQESRESPLTYARRRAREALQAGMPDDETTALIQTLLMGDSDDRLQTVWADFRASGTAHHLSISGMHLAVFAAFVVLIGRAFMLHPRNVLILAMSCALAYAAIVRPSPPVLRSILFCLAVGAAVLFRRHTDPVQCLFAAIMAMLIWNPMDFFNPGFQLSAGAVAALMLTASSVIGWFWSFENEHDRMARLIRPTTGLAAVLFRCRRWFIDAIAAGLVAYAITLPLVLVHFHQVNPWAIPGGIALAPIVGLTLLLGLAKAVVCLFIPSAGAWLAWPVTVAASLMREGVGWLAKLPGAELVAPPIPMWALIIYALLIAVPFIPWIKGRKAVWLAPTIAVLAMMAWPLASRIALPRQGISVTLLSVGNAATTVVELPDGNNAFVDCGGPRQQDLYENTIQPYLREEVIHTISDVVITHDDSDHCLALPQLQQQFSPRIWQHARADNQLAIAGQATWEVLGPHPLTPHRGNDASTVVRLTYAGKSILFTGDIQQDGIEELLRSGRPLAADILIAPHHGSCEEATGHLLAQVRPSLILSSSSAKRSGKQIKFDAMVADRRTMRTGPSGAIRILISPAGDISIRVFRNGEWR